MKHPIEVWAETHLTAPDAKALLGESVACYKTAAYRASLLMAYLSFMQTVRERILAAVAPNGYVATEWTDRTALLRDESGWDSATFDLVRSQKKPVFTVTEDLRTQVAYWKDRRNDCAHSKANRIEAAHVESFWAFLSSNLGKFVVIGSRDSLLEKLKRHYDINLTPPGSDIQPLVEELESSVEVKDIPKLLAELDHEVSVYLAGRRVVCPWTDFAAAGLVHKNQTIGQAFAKFVRDDEGLVDRVLNDHPERLQDLGLMPDQIRSLWQKKLSRDAGLHILATLLRNNLIPQAEVAEAIGRAVEPGGTVPPRDLDVSVLETAGYFKVLAEAAFDKKRIDDFGWGNSNAALVAWYLGRFPISDAAAQTISAVFREAKSVPYEARDAIQAMFASLPAKVAEYKVIESRLQLSVPDAIPSLK